MNGATQRVEDHFGKDIYAFLHYDFSKKSSSEIFKGIGDTTISCMDDIRASTLERAFLLDIIDHWESPKAKGVKAACCWVFKAPTYDDVHQALVQDLLAKETVR